MDAKKIMEALDRELQSHIDRMRQAIAELDKAQQPAEPVAWMADNGEPISAKRHEDMENAEHPLLVHYDTPLYTHPPQAAGLTVEQAMGIFMAWSTTRGHWYTLSDERSLRARLTAAIEAKQHLNR